MAWGWSCRWRYKSDCHRAEGFKSVAPRDRPGTGRCETAMLGTMLELTTAIGENGMRCGLVFGLKEKGLMPVYVGDSVESLLGWARYVVECEVGKVLCTQL